MDAEFCDGKAYECECRAADAVTAAERQEWLRMAAEWRIAGLSLSRSPSQVPQPSSA